MKKEDLEKKVLDLEAIVSKQNEELVNKKVKEHKEGYIHIPFSWGGFYRGAAGIGSTLLMIACLYGVYYFWGVFHIGNFFVPASQIDKSLISNSQLFFLYPLFAWFFSVWLMFICLKIWHDGNTDDVGDLVVGLVFGLVFGLE